MIPNPLDPFFWIMVVWFVGAGLLSNEYDKFYGNDESFFRCAVDSVQILLWPVFAPLFFYRKWSHPEPC